MNVIILIFLIYWNHSSLFSKVAFRSSNLQSKIFNFTLPTDVIHYSYEHKTFVNEVPKNLINIRLHKLAVTLGYSRIFLEMSTPCI